MPTRIIREPHHVDALASLLRGRKLPLTVSWTQGAPRRDAQNNLAFQWYQDIARQMGDRTSSQVRAECKVIFAAPILCEESEAFRASWTKLRHRFTHEEILVFVEETELPMTRLLNVKPMSDYMDRVQRKWSPHVRLTDPDALKYESEFQDAERGVA